ncbi:WXG100 family type VII secretion target [Actinomadura sp. 6N118]|uniref:WXG100 family type VII secretion target n=1 Tax=Actinomadura sp. 6N118 TaxID=3375151 RepID=UPI0037913DE2
MTDSRPQTTPLRVEATPPGEWDGGLDEMKQILQNMQPQRVKEAGTAYTNAAAKFETTAGLLRSRADALSKVWKGEDAAAAQKQMQRLNATSKEMDAKLAEAGRALDHHANQQIEFQRTAPGGGAIPNFTYTDATVFAAGAVIAGPAGGALAVGGKKVADVVGDLTGWWDSEEKALAKEHMKRLQDSTIQTNNLRMPKDVTTDLPYGGGNNQYTQPPRTDTGGGIPGGGIPGGGIPGGGVPGGGIPGGGTPGGGIPGGGVPGGGIPGGGTPGGGIPGGGTPGGGIPGGGIPGGGGGGGGSDLAGIPKGGGGGGIPGGGGLGGDPFGRSGLGGGGGGIPGGGAGGGGIPGGGMAGMPGAGMGGGAAGRGGAGTGKGSGLGKGGMRAGGMGAGPMGGAGGRGGGSEDENERSTWLTEDEDIWGGSDGDAAPPVIG